MLLKKKGRATFDTLNSRISLYFTPLILTIAIIAGVFWWFIEPARIPKIITAILIVACPCALALSTPFVLGNMIRYFGRLGFYLKNTTVIEHLKQINHVVFDKTGTLTQTNKQKITFNGLPLSSAESKLLGSVFYTSHHPLSNILYQFLAPKKIDKNFDFEQLVGRGVRATIKGKTITVGSAELMASVPFKPTTLDSIVHVEIEHTYRGYFIIPQLLRPRIQSLFLALEKLPITLLSGDNSSEINHLKRLLPKQTRFYFSQNPFQKIKHIIKLQSRKKKVLMVGDGLNDAGALKQSDIGLAVANQAHIFTPACDAIIRSERLPDLHHFLWAAKKSVFLIKLSFCVSFLYNCIGVSIAVAGLLSPLVAAILMPLSSISVVVFAYCSTAFVNYQLQKKNKGLIIVML